MVKFPSVIIFCFKSILLCDVSNEDWRYKVCDVFKSSSSIISCFVSIFVCEVSNGLSNQLVCVVLKSPSLIFCLNLYLFVMSPMKIEDLKFVWYVNHHH